MRCRIIGLGSYLPTRVVTNEELAPLALIRSRRIEELFEIRERHWVRRLDSAEPAAGQHCSDLGAEAARRAIDDAAIDPATIDTVVTVSTTPDFLSPSLDYLVSSKLNLRNTVNVDLRAACAGVFRAISLVEALMAAGRSTIALVVATEAMSPFFRFGPDVPKDHRMNTVLYADGAGAVILGSSADEAVGIQAVTVRTTGEASAPGVCARGMLSSTPPTVERFAAMDYLGYHDFRRVLDRGSEVTWRAAQEIFEMTGTTLADYKYLVTHQATGHMPAIGARYGIPAEKLPTNIERVGNTVSASTLILLDELKRAGRILPGDRVLVHSAESSTWSYGGMAIVWG